MISDPRSIDDDPAAVVAESVLFLLQANIDAMQELGREIEVLTATGGVVRSNCFCQRLADLSGMEVVRPRIIEATARGIAFEATGQSSQWKCGSLDRFYSRRDDALKSRYRRYMRLISQVE